MRSSPSARGRIPWDAGGERSKIGRQIRPHGETQPRNGGRESDNSPPGLPVAGAHSIAGAAGTRRAQA
jgi:hypothetical protein